MKLLALKKISSQLPNGATFETSERKGKLLIALKLAKAVGGRLSPEPTPINATPVPSDPASASPEPPPRGRYTRRDLRAKS